jgi:hypothetical protein
MFHIKISEQITNEWKEVLGTCIESVMDSIHDNPVMNMLLFVECNIRACYARSLR